MMVVFLVMAIIYYDDIYAKNGPEMKANLRMHMAADYKNDKNLCSGM